jgi:FtsZ-interacting cell division protein YlmF
MESQTCDSQRDNGLLSGAAVGATPAGRSERAAGVALSVLHASGVADAFEVIRVVRSNQAVLLNCSQLAARMGNRLIDICSGGVCAMDGQVHRISDALVLFAPALTRVTSD